MRDAADPATACPSSCWLPVVAAAAGAAVDSAAALASAAAGAPLLAADELELADVRLAAELEGLALEEEER